MSAGVAIVDTEAHHENIIKDPVVSLTGHGWMQVRRGLAGGGRGTSGNLNDPAANGLEETRPFAV